MNYWRPTKRYFSALSGLYGTEPVDPSQLKPRKKRRNIERQEQIKFNTWFDEYLWQKDCRWFHPANGGSRHQQEGSNFKRSGVKRGVPDIILPMARKSHHGLVIELKRPDGKLNDVDEYQQEWLDWFKRQGWSTHVAFGFEQAKAIVLDYFS